MGIEESIERLCGPNATLSESPFASGLPNVSVCFQHTILIWVPTIFFWILSPAFLFQSQRNSLRYPPLQRSLHFWLKVLSSLILTAISLTLFIWILFDRTNKHGVDYLYPILLTLTWGGITISHEIRLRTGMVSSGIIHITSTIFAVFSLPEMYQWSRMLHEDSVASSEKFRCFIALIYCPFAFLHVFLMFFADLRRKDLKSEEKRCPELESSFFSRLTLWWFNPIPAIGAKKDIEFDDLYDLNEASTTEYLSRYWNNVWEPKIFGYQQKAKATPIGTPLPDPPSVVAALFRIFRWEFLSATALKMISDVLQFANPFLLNALIGFISKKDAPLWQGIAYALLMFTASEIRSFVLNSYFYIMFRMGIKFQTVLTAAVYQKTLKLSNAARRDKTVGEIVNLMAIDVERFQLITPQIQQLWSCPFQITLALIYLFHTLGYAAAPGIVVMIIFVPVNIFSSMFVRRWQMQQMTLKDERTKLVNEMLNGIKVIKLYAWEVPMEEHINQIRQKELMLIKKAAWVRNVLDSFNTASPFMVALLSFGTYTLSSDEHALTPQVAFVSLTLFNQLRSPMTMIAMLINQIVQAIVSNRRLKEFFVAPELDENAVDRIDGNSNVNAVEMIDVDAVWDAQEHVSKTSGLQHMSLEAKPGALVAVVGRVGAGKSSLISALLGEMEKLKGIIGVRGRVAYVPQQPWIQNLSLKDNILFGRPYDKQRYQKVISACALRPDLKILPHGDLTEIGEKGINLSGGQKARVALARAVYQDCDVYLLDDPLSAVDSHVGRHIFDYVIGPNGLLRGKTRILVTHGLTFIRDADPIVVLKDGLIAEQGTYDELVEMGGAFADFVKEIKSKKPADNDEDSDSEGWHEDGKEKQINDESDGEDQEKPLLNTQVSVLTVKSTTGAEDGKKLIQKEMAAEGSVKISIYRDYVKAATYTLSFLFAAGFTLFSVFQIVRSFWLSAWSDENDPSHTGHKMELGTRLGVYGALGVVESLWFLVSQVLNLYGGLSASRRLHRPLIMNLLHSPMSFFDTTPLGRILNRCAKDIEVIDMLLPMNFRYYVMCILQVITTLIVIIISTPLFAAVILPLGGIYIWFLRYYVPTSRQLKRLEGINRSPIYSHFGESIQGAASIRAFNKVDSFVTKSGETVDRFIRCKYPNIVSNRWLAIRLEFIGNCVIFFAALFATLSKEWGWSSSAGIVGVSISYALNITEVLNFAVRQISEIEANIVSVERVNEYTKTPNEAPWRLDNNRGPPKGWPKEGRVEFDNYATRYREGLDLVLKRFSARVNAGEKIGIVGRTGAGKSSFALALFRMIEPAEGRILIDGEDLSQMGLHDLRENITIIPQDPVLFSGTLRFNLDPFAKATDREIWKALELSSLKEMVERTDRGLEHIISEGGENISVGQRQLVCLARALLRRTKVLVLDEATAAVDLQTDSLIQKTIREQFTDCTVFTIAHRLNTILDYDRIMVLDHGEIREFAPPNTLLADRNSIFAKMVADAEQENKKA
ncbi:unnamed protein product, partial [Mesorhabditis belari]|uniref:Uncharacterized protein n=1 Tax=Mesorhabditis belari TaxID=2138241 RepID=A0AAF3FKC9_9BILA